MADEQTEQQKSGPSPQGDRGARGNRPPGQGREGRGPGPDRGPGGRPGGESRGPGGDRGRGGPGGDRRMEGPPEIDLDKLIGDSLYLDNQAHVVVSRMRDLDSGTRSTLRRLYNAVRRATRTPENERQHAFVMLRARLA